jgi:hypothetical protein
MPLHPAPTIQGNMLIVTQSFLRSDMSRAAQVGYMLSCGASDLATYQDAIDDFQANFNANITPKIDNEVSVLPPVGRGGDGTDVPLLVIAAGAAATGGSANPYVPPNCAALFRKRTAAGGRQNRGRTYMPFILDSGDVSENGTINPALVAVLNTALAAFLAQLVTDSTPMAIENKHFSAPPPPLFVTSITASAHQVTSYTCESLIATQRRRLGR